MYPVKLFSTFLLFALCMLSTPGNAQVIEIDTLESGQGPFQKHFVAGQRITDITVKLKGIDDPGSSEFTWTICSFQNCDFESDGDCKDIADETSESIFSNGSTNYFKIKKDNQVQAKISPGPSFFFDNKPAAGKYCFTITATGNGVTYQRDFEFIVRKPNHIVMLIDKSMSMECKVGKFPSLDTNTGDMIQSNPAVQNNNQIDDDCTQLFANEAKRNRSRWYGIREGIKNFVSKLNDQNKILAGDDGDKMSLLFFSGSVNSSSNLSQLNRIGVLIGRNEVCEEENIICLIDEMVSSNGGILGRDGTSIGSGLGAAFDRLSTNDDFNQSIILFSDGSQTHTPKVEVNEEGEIELYSNATDNSTIINSTTNTLDTTYNKEDYNLDLYVIAAGVPHAGGYHELMSNLSSGTNYYVGGRIGSNKKIISGLDNRIFNQFNARFSPKNLLIKEQPLFEKNVATVKCQSKVNKLIFDFYFQSPMAKYFNYRLFRNSVPIEEYIDNSDIDLRVGDYSASITLNFDEINASGAFHSGGEWTMVATEIFSPKEEKDNPVLVDPSDNPLNVDNTSSFPLPETIRMIVTGDDHITTFNPSLNQESFRVGDEIRPQVDFSVRGETITWSEVTVTVTKPASDVSSILADIDIDYDPLSETEGCIAQKIAYLQEEDPELLASINSVVTQQDTLKYEENGRYLTRVNKGFMADVAGVYEITYLAKGILQNGETVQRTLEQSLVVSFGELDKASKLNKIDTDGNIITYEFCPFYISPKGKKIYLGPDYKYAINVEGKDISSVSVTSESCDNCYLIKVTTDGPGKKPAEKVCISGDCIEVKKPSSFSRLLAGLNFGYAVPSGKLADTQPSGLTWEAYLTYLLAPDFGLEANVGLHNFNSFDQDAGNFNILSGILYAKGQVRLGEGSFSALTAGLGLGWYNPDDYDASMGWSARASVVPRLSQHGPLYGNVEIAYHNISESKLTFTTFLAGIKYRF